MSVNFSAFLRWRYVGIYLFAFAMPLPIPLRLTAGFFVLMLINVLLLTGDSKIPALLKDKFLLIFFSFFAIDFIRSIFFFDPTFLGFKEVKLAFALIPFLFLWKRRELLMIRKTVFIFFLLGVLTYICYAWLYAMYFYTIKFPHYSITLTDGYLNYLFDYHLPGSIHEAYIGSYIAFGAIVVYICTIIQKKVSFRLGLGFVIFLSMNLFYIGSKSVVFLFILLLLFTTVYLYFEKLSDRIFRSAIIAVGAIVMFGVILMVTWLPSSIKSSIEKRAVIYDCVAKVATINPWIGVGYQDVRSSSRFCIGYEGELMTHNVFFSELVANGLGVVVLVVLAVYLLYVAFSARDLVLGSLVFLCVGVGMVEDVFNRQWGVFFFVFFTTLAYLSIKKT
jgi:hypothetical protein